MDYKMTGGAEYDSNNVKLTAFIPTEKELEWIIF